MTAKASFQPAIATASDDTAFSKLAAEFFIARLETLKDPLIVLPTGNTPLGLYRELISTHRHRRDIWDQVRFLSLDEYVGLQSDDPRLFYGWLRLEFLDRAGIPESHRMVFRSDAPDPAAESARIDAWLQQNGPIDLAVLGLGTNGHIAFNEPGTPFSQPAHVVTLTPETIRSNAGYWGGADRVPKTAMTLGLGNLATARQTLLLVSGAHKADILGRVLHDPVSPAIPATYLRTIPGVMIIADQAALPPAP